jgi:hypothetical protein
MYQWHEAVDFLRPRIVRIATPTGTGSGFLLPWNSKSGLCAIATASHVIDHAFYWEQPIRIDQVDAGKSALVRQEQRAIFSDSKRDTAVIVIESSPIESTEGDLRFIPEEKYLKVGNEVGWLGFPAIAQSLCFFSGRLSAWLKDDKAYLVDGVAVNGVSGGALFSLHAKEPMIIGIVSAYMPNRATGEVLPGLAIARDISFLHEQATTFTSIDEARAAQSVPEPPLAPPVESESPTTPTRSAG